MSADARAPSDAGAGFLRSGKVRDLYALDDARLLLVASDRISAFDVVLPSLVPDKGRVLTGLSRYWFGLTRAIVADHLLGADPADLPAGFASDGEAEDELRGRMIICRRVVPLPAEIIVRGYISGSGWSEYQRNGSVCGVPLPAGLRESDRLPQPIFTPSTKADVGHDENIDFDRLVELVGGAVAERAREIALAVYQLGADRAAEADILLADTKLELGIGPAGPGVDPDDPASRVERIVLIDEVMTPDSSRFWEAGAWNPGQAQPSFDKQFVRDWLTSSGWDRAPPGPELPPDVIAGTRDRYVAAFERITGGSFRRYLEEDSIGVDGGPSEEAGVAS